jgi:3-deoxy-D-manno-octulosonic-acid transferase
MKGIPTLLLSGRLSVRALHKYSRFGAFFRQVTSYFTAMGMQSKEDADRITRLGAHAHKVRITGSLKHLSGNGKPGGHPKIETKARGNKLLLVVGSSHRGEEEILLKVFLSLRNQFPTLRMVLAPRHPQRFAEVEKLLVATGLRFAKKSQDNGWADFSNDVILVDTLGDLESFYALGDLAFVGGSLVQAGGHNLLEPARFRKPVLFGPHMTNFSALAAEMKQNGAGIEVCGMEDLRREIAALLSDPRKRKAIGEKAYEIALDDRGTLEQSIGLVSPYL